MLRRTWIAAATALILAQPVFPHPGGTNADGCHTDRRTGEYHCHNPKPPVPDRVTYCHVVDGERRCGYARSTCAELVAEFGGSCQRQ
ncbi:MAG TPA: YHYH domain-containing protein [Gammaproteobacteria bacterium]